MHGHHGSHGRGRDTWRRASPAGKALLIVGGALLSLGCFALIGVILMWLWNWLMPTILGLPSIGFWQSVGLLILSSILFKRMPSGHRMAEVHRKQALRERMRAQGYDEETEAGQNGTEKGE